MFGTKFIKCNMIHYWLDRISSKYTYYRGAFGGPFIINNFLKLEIILSKLYTVSVSLWGECQSCDFNIG